MALSSFSFSGREKESDNTDSLSEEMLLTRTLSYLSILTWF